MRKNLRDSFKQGTSLKEILKRSSSDRQDNTRTKHETSEIKTEQQNDKFLGKYRRLFYHLEFFKTAKQLRAKNILLSDGVFNIQCPKTDPRKYEQLIFYKKAEAVQWRNESSS